MTAPTNFADTTTPLLGHPGTSAMPRSPMPTHRFVVATLLTGATMLGGTVVNVTPADAAALWAAGTTARTVPAASPQTPATAVDSRSVPSLLRRLRDRAKLNWGDVAQAMGVSRRTIHNWLNGGQLAAHHLSRLLELEMVVEVAGARDSSTTRVYLTAPGPQGRSILGDFALGSRPMRNVPLSTVSAADLLEPDAAETSNYEVAQAPSRRSSLHGGPLPGRRPQAT